MTKFYPILLLFLLVSVSSAAQQPWPAAYELGKDSIPNMKLEHRYWQLLADPSGRLSLEQVQKLPFRPAGSDSVPLRSLAAKQVYWIRYQIRNRLSRTVSLAWPREMNRADIYTMDQTGRRTAKTTGSSIPWSAMPDQKQFSEVSLRIGGGQTVRIYERQEFYPQNDNLLLSARLRIGNDPARRLEDYYEGQLSLSTSRAFDGGFLLLAALITLFFYIVSREKLYLYFSLFGLAYGGSAFCLVVFNSFFREYPQIELAGTLLVPICLFLLWHFLALFYRLPEHYSRWYRINTVLSWVFLLLGLYWYFSFTLFAVITVVMRITAAAFLLSGVLSLFWGIFRKGEGRLKRLLTALPFLAIGICYLTLALLLSALQAGAALRKELDNWAGTITSLCFYWMVGSFLWNLIERFQYLQKQVLQETLARERLARENEKERLALMAAQTVELEKQVAGRTAELQQSLTELKLTQSQLIQSEKMASLGELTAGIAHEIQNPLNFVNNFSEVSVELLAELKEEATSGRTSEVLDLAEDLTQNLEKIHHHGKRADNIVKGMLEHSRAGSGTKEPTDLNKLAEEYLKLAFHGLRSRDKSFNAELITRFDDSLPLVNVVPQDIGRVLLNLFNNAFYAVQQHKKTGGDDYQPLVELQTFAPISGGWGAAVRDNGIGIPENIKSKIMQPFFTTKPTGEGTGLGLSLSYDILIKGHDGSIDVQSVVGEGAVFTITLR